jgi:serine/threonine protein kinase
MQIRCPSCHAPFDVAAHASWAEMSCPTCGSTFGLAGADTTAHYEPRDGDDNHFDAPPSDSRLRTLGHFELLEEVGVGAFGTVYRARDTQLERQVAIKIPRSRQLDAQQLEMFLRDARSAAQLKHPHIVSVFEVGRQDDTVYIVSDLVDGVSLKDRLASERLSVSEAVRLVITIARAVHHAPPRKELSS